jgi:hypothetical protein
VILHASKKVHVKALINSGAQDLELVVPRSVWKQMGAKRERKSCLIFGGKNFLSDTCKVSAGEKSRDWRGENAELDLLGSVR